MLGKGKVGACFPLLLTASVAAVYEAKILILGLYENATSTVLSNEVYFKGSF